MEGLQGLRSQIKELYRIHGVKLQILFKGMMLAAAIFTINNTVGSISILKNPIISLLLASLLSILPISLGITIIGLVAIGHIFKISILVAAVALILLFLLGMLSLRLSPDSKYTAIAAFVISSIGGAFSTPIILAMTSQISAVIPMLSGLISYRVLWLIKNSKETLAELSLVEAGLEFVEVLSKDGYLLCLIVITSFSFIAASIIKRVDAVESWKVGIVVGAGTNLVIGFLVKMILSTKLSILSILIWTIVGVVIGLIVEFFIHNVNYKATEMLDFEDDEYFYYVKAVPKKVKDPAPKVSESRLGKKSVTKGSARGDKKNTTTRNANTRNTSTRNTRDVAGNKGNKRSENKGSKSNKNKSNSRRKK